MFDSLDQPIGYGYILVRTREVRPSREMSLVHNSTSALGALFVFAGLLHLIKNKSLNWRGQGTPLSGGSVIINFIGPNENFTVPNKIEKHYADGERYSIDIPLITGYTPDREKVEGTMRTSDIVITVTYFANEHEIKVKTGQTDLETPEGWTKESDGVFS